MKRINRLALKMMMVAFCLCVVACKGKVENKISTDKQPCRTLVVKSNEIDNKWYYVGDVEAIASVSVGFRIPGTVQTLLVREGDVVKKGQLLATLDPQDVQKNFDIASSTLRQAEDAMRRIQMMHDEHSISDIKFVEVQTKLEQAQSVYALAKQRLEDTHLYAPVSGVIGKRKIEVGENYGVVVSAFTILDMSEVLVKIPVPEREIPKIKKGDRALVHVLALGDSVSFNATVDEISVAADHMTHSYEVRLRLPNKDGSLMHGMVCNVQLWPDATRHQYGYILPVPAVKVTPNNNKYVWVVRNGKAHRQYVSVGMYSKDGVVVTGGLSDGDHVIVGGQHQVSENQSVEEL